MEMVMLLAMATFLAFSYFAGRLGAFVAPGYVWLTPAAAVVLYAMLLARLVAYVRDSSRGEACHAPAEEHHAHGDEHHGWHVPLSGCVAVLLVPIVLALWINPQQLSAEGARKRRIPTPPRNVKLEKAFAWVLGWAGAAQTPGARADALPKDPSVLDLMGAVDEGRAEAIEGLFVTMTGQCDLRGSSAERFDLYRLVINCCIADATSVSVEVAPPAGVNLDPGGWVRVGGIIKFDSPLDPALPVVHAATISRIPEPSKPYL
jgi:uncharacterized repeat protein (TIGR03943 family)